MNRLTKKQENQLSCHHYKKCDYLRNGTPRVETLTKLGKLEDIEEQLGCSLEVVFEALDEGIIINNTLEKLPSLLKLNSINKWCFEMRAEIYFLSDYQKTWWLKGEKTNE